MGISLKRHFEFLMKTVGTPCILTASKKNDSLFNSTVIVQHIMGKIIIIHYGENITIQFYDYM